MPSFALLRVSLYRASCVCVCVSSLGPESAVGTAHFGHFGSLLFCHFRKTFVGVERKRLSVAVMIQTKAGVQDVGECGKGQRWRLGGGRCERL